MAIKKYEKKASYVVVLLAFLSSALCADALAANEQARVEALSTLASAPVSRLEWGIDKLRRALEQHFSIDPLTLAPSNPRYFVNVDYKSERGVILIELGRTLASLKEADAKPMCAEMIARIRSFLSVDKLGQPSIKNSSALALDYFHPLDASEPPSDAFAAALDASVQLRGLVASPINGVYSICGAGLTHSPVRHVE